MCDVKMYVFVKLLVVINVCACTCNVSHSDVVSQLDIIWHHYGLNLISDI